VAQCQSAVHWRKETYRVIDQQRLKEQQRGYGMQVCVTRWTVSILLAAAVKQNAAVLTIAAGLDPVVRPQTPARRRRSKSQHCYGVLLFSIQHSSVSRSITPTTRRQGNAYSCYRHSTVYPTETSQPTRDFGRATTAQVRALTGEISQRWVSKTIFYRSSPAWATHAVMRGNFLFSAVIDHVYRGPDAQGACPADRHARVLFSQT
jgi:hypothetical protein